MFLVYIQYIVLESFSILKYTYTTENNTIIKITAWTKEEWDEIQMCLTHFFLYLGKNLIALHFLY